MPQKSRKLKGKIIKSRSVIWQTVLYILENVNAEYEFKQKLG